MKVNDLLEKLDGVFGNLNPTRAAAYIGEMMRMLSQYQGGTLEAAYERIMSDWTERFRPLPAHFAKECRMLAHSSDKNAAQRKELIDQQKEFRRREFRGFIDRTLQRYSAEIEPHVNAWGFVDVGGVQISIWRECVIAHIEIKARLSQWYERGQSSPHALDIESENWKQITELATRVGPMMRRNKLSLGLPKPDETKEEIRKISFMRDASFDGYQADAS